MKYLPQPYFLIDRNYEIHSFSNRSEIIFDVGKNFLQLVDWESTEKAKKLLEFHEGLAEGELIMKTRESPYALIDLSMNWEEEMCHIICTEKDHRLSELENIVESHRIRLAETDLELLEKKDQVEEKLLEIKKLSCPFIKLTKRAALIPMFGSLDGDLIRLNEEKLLRTAQKGDYEEILFDFNGVDEFKIDGVEALVSLVKELQIMGIKPSMIGIKPNHAFYLNNTNTRLDVPFLNSLSKAFKKWIKRREHFDV
ncbi:STAS domain-containing protein [Bacillus sp. REN3]|uniref:STAS domain-containing protein n=1 Tax=Bacillus sp. REN3 TaxID=2802440 RepID=UPI0032BFFB91